MIQITFAQLLRSSLAEDVKLSLAFEEAEKILGLKEDSPIWVELEGRVYHTREPDCIPTGDKVKSRKGNVTK
jgi:hypothetical protein